MAQADSPRLCNDKSLTRVSHCPDLFCFSTNPLSEPIRHSVSGEGVGKLLFEEGRPLPANNGTQPPGDALLDSTVTMENVGRDRPRAHQCVYASPMCIRMGDGGQSS